MKIKTYQIVVLTLILISICFFAVPYFVTQHQGFWSYNQGTAFIGDTLGGIAGPTIAFIGVILTFLAFYIQYEANNVQRKALYIDQFESKFFELIRMHRENVSRIVYEKNEGLIALKQLSIELQKSFNKIEKLNSQKLLTDLDMLKISFYLFYFGLSNSTKSKVNEEFNPDNNKEISSLLRLIYTDLDTWIKDGAGTKIITDQESRLEIYFRHIYHMTSFLHQQKNKLSDPDKLFFRETIVSQLSTYEICMLVYYSISDLGQHWLNPINFVKEYNFVDKIKEDTQGASKQVLTEIIN